MDNCILLLMILVIMYLFSIQINSTSTCLASKDDDIRTLTRQCARWLIAAQQDKSPLIATLHVQYGMGYLWAIKDIATADEFKRSTGLDFPSFEKHATSIQDSISKQMIGACPQFAGDVDTYLGWIAGEV